jgi:hypothetical protein
MNVVNESGRFGISIYSSIGLMAVIAHRQLLQARSVRLLIEAILEMVREPQNAISNKIDLINGIIELSDTLTPELAEEVFETLNPVAAGKVVGLDVTKAAGDPNHPLNRFKVRLGDPATLQGGALYALACIETHQPGLYGPRLTTLLDQGIVSPNSTVRKLAFTAARRAPTLPDSILTNVLLGTRDNDPEVVEQAFLTISRHLLSSEDFVRSLIYSLAIACQSLRVNTRRAAAYVIRMLLERQLNEELRDKLQELEETLRTDICFSVRSIISPRESD